MGVSQLTRILHSLVGVVMFTSSIIMFFRYWYRDLINRGDIFWVKNVRKAAVNGEIGDAGCYNFGQRYAPWAAIIFLVPPLVSGMTIRRPYFVSAFSTPVARSALILHSFAAVALIVVIMMHVYTALWVKDMITTMVEGWVTSAWVKKHHPRWYHEVRKTTEKKAE